MIAITDYTIRKGRRNGERVNKQLLDEVEHDIMNHESNPRSVLSAEAEG